MAASGWIAKETITHNYTKSASLKSKNNLINKNLNIMV